MLRGGKEKYVYIDLKSQSFNSHATLKENTKIEYISSHSLCKYYVLRHVSYCTDYFRVILILKAVARLYECMTSRLYALSLCTWVSPEGDRRDADSGPAVAERIPGEEPGMWEEA